MDSSLREAAERAVSRARRRGARAADAWAEHGRESSVRVRDGEIEEVRQAAGKGVGLRVVAAGRLGFAYGSDLGRAGIETLVDRAFALAQASAPDPANRLPSARDLARRHGDLGLFDPAVEDLSPDWKVEAAKTMEKVGRGVDARVKTFETVGVADIISEIAIATGEGLSDSFRGTSISLFAAAVAQADDGQLQTGWRTDERRFLADLDPIEAVGREAAEHALAMLGATKGPTRRVPVVLKPRYAASFFENVAAALDGKRVLQQASFLAGKLGRKIAPATLGLTDDGLWPRGVGSRPFDGEGLPTRKNPLIERGRLAAFLYDTATAHRAGARSTATAAREYRSLPRIGTTTLVVEAEKTVPAGEIIGGVADGLYVTGMLGHGGNPVTGDFSQGASGLWIEKGEVTRPVQELTIAGNLLDMLAGIDAIGDDRVMIGTTLAPTIRFAELTVAGE